MHTPPVHPQFNRALRRCPHFNTSTEPDYHRLISSYGTHFIRSMELGGCISALTALRTCELALEGLTRPNEVEDCLAVEAEVSISSRASASPSFMHGGEEEEPQDGTSFHCRPTGSAITMSGGGHHSTMHDLGAWNQAGPEQFSAWVVFHCRMKSWPVDYTLEPCTLFCGEPGPAAEALRRAVSKYVTGQGTLRDCNLGLCPPGATQRTRRTHANACASPA